LIILCVIKRTPEYSKLIDKLIDEKSFIFSQPQLKALKNPQQIFKLSDNNQDIKNISEMVYNDCNKELNFNNNTNTYDYLDNENNIDLSDSQYGKIKKN
jgi:hypothetical protein